MRWVRDNNLTGYTCCVCQKELKKTDDEVDRLDINFTNLGRYYPIIKCVDCELSNETNLYCFIEYFLYLDSLVWSKTNINRTKGKCCFICKDSFYNGEEVDMLVFNIDRRRYSFIKHVFCKKDINNIEYIKEEKIEVKKLIIWCAYKVSISNYAF